MYTLINGSSKLASSNSLNFLNIIKRRIDKYNIFSLIDNNFHNIIESINISDTIVFAFPLYVDSPNYQVLKFLDYTFDNDLIRKKNVYIIINCGFLEGEQNITALNIIKRWCDKTNNDYLGAILIGAGEIVGKKKYKLVCTKARNKLKHFGKCIKENKKTNDIIATMDLLNSKVYCMLANISWNRKAKKNNLTKEDINKK